VYGTTKIWRELIDGGKNAKEAQMKQLSYIFSRGGYTDKYFTDEYRKNNRDMYGVRSEDDKEATRETEKKLDFSRATRKRKVEISFFAEAEKNVNAFISCDGISVSVTSDFVCPAATGRPLTDDDAKGALSKLGNTYFEVCNEDIDVKIKGDIFLGKSMINSVRRSLVEELEKALYNPEKVARNTDCKTFERRQRTGKTVCIHSCISLDVAKNVKHPEYISIPLLDIEKADKSFINTALHFGVTLPRVIYSSEMSECMRLLSLAKEKGAEFALVSNIGQVEAVKKSGLSVFGDIGMNGFNSHTIGVLEDMGFSLVTVSPELNEAQIRDLEKKNGTKLCAFVKGRLPVMVLESCIVRAGGKCKMQNGYPCGGHPFSCRLA
ncbi:MAG: DUF3656 domain-containing protein, partial [Clostridia bacterium]|nr:DUF3656 domain-containing protein [Clostridia bacterium]